MATKTRHGPIQIEWENDGSVSVVGKDKHRFLLTMKQAAEACARGHEQLVFLEEFNKLLRRIHEWIRANEAMIAAVYFAVVERQLVFFVVPVANEMDMRLSDHIAALEAELFNEFANVRCEIRQIPGPDAEALSTFLDLNEAVLLHAG